MKYILVALVLVLFSSGALSSGAIKHQFQQEVKELVRYLKMPREKMQHLMSLMWTLKDTLVAHWPGSEVNIIGSVSYGLGMQYSDLDLVAILPGHTDDSYESNALVTEEAKTLLQQQTVFTNLFTWTNLTIAVLSFEHAPTQIDIDILINTQSERQRSQLVRYLLNLDRRAHYLAFIVKYWSNVACKYFPRNHGYMLLVIFYLQQKLVLPSIASLQKNAKPYMLDAWDYGFDKLEYQSLNNESLESIIGGFFTFYGEFDFEKHIVSPYAGYPVPKHAFNGRKTTPPEYKVYKKNLKNKKSEPLPVIDGVMIQDEFAHNEYMDNSLVVSEFKAVFKEAETTFQRDPMAFLKHLRKLKSLAEHIIMSP